jgi:hypothetical protein
MYNWKPDEKHVAYSILEWIKVAREAYKKPDWLPANADVDHSALLMRILSGDKPQKNPPPTAFSYPWYDLFDDAPFTDHPVVDVYVRTDLGAGPTVVINQSVWNIIEVIEENMHYIVKYPPNEELFDLKFKAYTKKQYLRSTKEMVNVPAEGWFLMMKG